MDCQLSNLIIKRVYYATTIYTEENSKMSIKNRKNWAVLIKYEGETEYYQDNEIIISNINNLVVLPKGCCYQWRCTKTGHFSIIEFDCDLENQSIYSFPVKNGEKLLKTFKDLEYRIQSKQPLYQMESIKETYSLMLKLLSQSDEIYVPRSKEERLIPAIDYISKNYNKDIKNDDLAEITGLSTVYFRKLFTEVYGVSPMSFVKNVRIRKAKEMLRSDYGSITDIAVSLGYSNIYDFSRDFKKHVGVSPTKYTS